MFTRLHYKCLLVFTVSMVLSCSKTSYTQDFFNSTMEEQLLADINNYRQSKNLSILQLDNILESEARNHCRDMAIGKSNIDTTGFNSMISRLTLIYGDSINVAESVTYGQRTSSSCLTWWEGHKTDLGNLTGDYNFAGCGVVINNQDIYYYTTVFMKVKK